MLSAFHTALYLFQSILQRRPMNVNIIIITNILTPAESHRNANTRRGNVLRHYLTSTELVIVQQLYCYLGLLATSFERLLKVLRNANLCTCFHACWFWHSVLELFLQNKCFRLNELGMGSRCASLLRIIIVDMSRWGLSRLCLWHVCLNLKLTRLPRRY